MDVEKLELEIERALAVRDTWLAVVRIARRRPEKKLDIPIRRCQMLALKAENHAVELKNMLDTEKIHRRRFKHISNQLVDLATRADHILLELGMGGHRGKLPKS